ncbi:MAG: transcription termination/antitermination protein NusG [Verrucomicrobiota bacterium]
MPNPIQLSEIQWYAVQTLSNQEAKVKRYLDKFIEVEEMGDYIKEVLMPTETVTEVKSGKKYTKQRKLYPGYVFIHMRMYDDNSKVLQKPWYFVRGVQGIIGFIGGDNPVPLKQDEINRILDQVKQAEGQEKPKVEYEVGEEVKITDGPFLNLTGRIDEIDPERGKLKVSVSIFGRFTPVELEYWQIERAEES